MIRDVLQSIKGIEIYPIISLIIFVSFFIGLGIWIFRMDKDKVNKNKNLPFNNENNQNTNSGELNEKNN